MCKYYAFLCPNGCTDMFSGGPSHGLWESMDKYYEPGNVAGFGRTNHSYDLYIDLLKHQVLGVIRQTAHKVEIPAAQIVSFEHVYFIYHVWTS